MEKTKLSVQGNVKKSKIILLDEATSSLDSKRRKDTNAIKLLANKTAVIIAHRLSTILSADEFMLLIKEEC